MDVVFMNFPTDMSLDYDFFPEGIFVLQLSRSVICWCWNFKFWMGASGDQNLNDNCVREVIKCHQLNLMLVVLNFTLLHGCTFC